MLLPPLILPQKTGGASLHMKKTIYAVKTPRLGTNVVLPSLECAPHPPSKPPLTTRPRHYKSSSKPAPPTVSLEEPVEPQYIIKHYSAFLSEKEMLEISKYPLIYYFTFEKSRSGRKSSSFFHFRAGEAIAYRYEQQKFLGKGSFGCVIQCYDHKEKQIVAIKMLRDKKKVHKQLVFELDIFRRLQSKEDNCLVNLLDSFVYKGFFCISMELMGLDTYTVLQRNKFKGFPKEMVKRIAKQVTTGLAFMHSRNVVHCDIKPENIIFTSDDYSSVKLIDFGCSCYSGKVIFTYIQSRFYRAPEVVLGIHYNSEIDIWSLGCVLVELATGIPLFEADNEGALMAKMVKVLGDPPTSFLKSAPRAKVYFNESGQLKQKVPRTTVAEATKICDTVFLDLVESCLRWTPKERPTAQELLNHPWFL